MGPIRNRFPRQPSWSHLPAVAESISNAAKGIDELSASVRSLVREMRWDMGDLPFKISGLADHAAVYYATLLWNELLETPEATTPRLPS